MRLWKTRSTSARPAADRAKAAALLALLALLPPATAGAKPRHPIRRHRAAQAAAAAAEMRAAPSAVVPSWHKTREATLRELDSLNRSLTHQLCRAGADHQYNRLLSEYRGTGYYLPELPDGSPDLDTIRQFLPMVREKSKWIASLAADLKEDRQFPGYPELTQPLQTELDALLDLKRAARFAKDLKEQKRIRMESRDHMRRLGDEYRKVTSRIPFLLSYGFPVDHHAARVSFERLKAGKPSADRKSQANRIFFERRIHEDGAFDPDRTRYDLFLRSTLDTLAVRLAQPEDFLPEDVRYDLEWAIKELDQTLSRGRLVHLQRAKAWLEKNDATIEFYEGVLKETEPERAKQTAERIRASNRLRNFVLTKHAQAYAAVSRQPEMLQALWVIQKILFNEVGGLDREFGLEKRDITQVVINRRSHHVYSTLPPDDSLVPYLRKTSVGGGYNRYPWLNTLFRTGEFSFTYYYIPSVVNVFCPDRSKHGQEILREDALIAYDMLVSPNADFQGLRYFSRKSMTGKIDMASSWPEYVAIPERPGVPLRESDRTYAELIQKLTENKYRYLYQFTAPDGQQYDVVEIDGTTYAVQDLGGAPLIHYYRDPHAFTYFRRFFGDFSQD